LENGVLTWCDHEGVAIEAKDLNRMKHSGKVFLKIVGVNRLPTAYELTGNDSWDLDGEFHQMYDLGLDSGEDVLSADFGENVDLNTDDDWEEVENSGDEDGVDGGVKVLSFRTNEEVMEIINQAKQESPEPDATEVEELFNEFDGILSTDETAQDGKNNSSLGLLTV